MDKAEWEIAGIGNVKRVYVVELAVVTELGIRYETETFEVYERGNAEKTEDALAKS